MRIKKLWNDLKNELISKNLRDSIFYNEILDDISKNNFVKHLYNICQEVTVFLQMGYVHSESLDNDQEKEIEVEIIEEQEVIIKIEKRDPALEKIWDFESILQNNFISTAIKFEIIIPIKYIKNFIEEPCGLQKFVWNKNIFMTTNFINTVLSIETKNFDNYLRLVDVVLIHREKNKNSKLIILSGKEASNIKSLCYAKLENNLLVHIKDINGTTQLPEKSIVSKEEEKLLTIIKLFSGECHYTSKKEVLRLAKRLGRLYPDVFITSAIKKDNNININKELSEKIYGMLIENDYLDFAGIMTKKLLNVLSKNLEHIPTLNLPNEYQKYNQYISHKFYKIYNKLIVKTSDGTSLNYLHNTLWQWIGTQKRLKEYTGSALESILNSEYKIKQSE